jgi:malate permease and related proteins
VIPGTATLLHLVLPVFVVIGAGYALRRLGVLSEEGGRSLLGVLIKLLVPCLALDVILGNEALDRPANWLVPPLAGFAVAAAGYGSAWVVGRLLLRGGRGVGTFASITGLQNYSYIPLPLCLALFDRGTVGVLFAFNLGVEVAMWTLGVAMFGGGARMSLWRILRNPPVVAVVAGLVLNALGAGGWTPDAVGTAMGMLGGCAVPLGLLMTGAVLADHMRPGVLREGWGQIAGAVVLRLGVMSGLVLAAAVWLPVDDELRRVMVVQSAMPCAVFPVVLAKLHGGDMPMALRIALGTSVAGLVTIPLWLGWAMRFAG